MWRNVASKVWKELKDKYYKGDQFRIAQLQEELFAHKQGIVRKYKEVDYVVHFLRGLNDQYRGVRSQIMLMDSIPSINKVFSLLSHHE